MDQSFTSLLKRLKKLESDITFLKDRRYRNNLTALQKKVLNKKLAERLELRVRIKDFPEKIII